MESTLVIVLAETRAHEHTFDLFASNVLGTYDADLCLCVADNPREDTENPFYKKAEYVWKFPEPEDWGEAFDFACESEDGDPEWRQLLSIKDQWLGGVRGAEEHPGSAGILLFFRWFLKHKLLETGVHLKYDRFVITRSDYIHRLPQIPLRLLDPDFIWVPQGEDYGGITDRHVVVHQRDLLKVLSVVDPMLQDPNGLRERMSYSNEWNLEKYLQFSFREAGILARIKRFPATMYTVRAASGHTRWQGGQLSKSLGYHIKYEEEHRKFLMAKQVIRNSSDWSHNTISSCLVW